MPPKKGGAKGKKKIPRESEEEALTTTDVQYNPDIINGLLVDLKSQVDVKSALIKKDIDFMATSIRQAFHLELIKLPKQVKEMSLSRFKLEFGDNLEAVTRGAMEGKKLQSQRDEKVAPSTASKSARSQSKVFQTPVSGKNYVMETPSTRKLRNAREGEVILSCNGSPLGEFSTVVKAPKSAASIVPATPGVFVPLKTGEIVNVEELTELSDEVKEEAITKMQEMMNNMQSMMEKFRLKK
jgi:hypothetical protein